MSDLAYGVTNAISWAVEEGWKGIPTAAIAKVLINFEAVDYKLEALVLQWLAEVYRLRLCKELVRRVMSQVNPELKKYCTLRKVYLWYETHDTCRMEVSSNPTFVHESRRLCSHRNDVS
jgi:hypothetical protein